MQNVCCFSFHSIRGSRCCEGLAIYGDSQFSYCKLSLFGMRLSSHQGSIWNNQVISRLSSQFLLLWRQKKIFTCCIRIHPFLNLSLWCQMSVFSWFWSRNRNVEVWMIYFFFFHDVNTDVVLPTVAQTPKWRRSQSHRLNYEVYFTFHNISP